MGLLEAVKNVVKGAATIASAVASGNQGHSHGNDNSQSSVKGPSDKDKKNMERKEFSSKEVQSHADTSAKLLKENTVSAPAGGEKSAGFKQQSSVSQNTGGVEKSQSQSVKSEPAEKSQAKQQSQNMDRDR